MSFLHVNGLNDSSTKIKALRDAKIMQKAIAESCAKDGKQAPPYHLTELIGKGSFGRVYKAKSSTKGQVVAIKIIDIEQGDTPNPRLADTFSDLLKEINALQLLSASGAKNINHVIEAIPVGQSMWVVTEYCAGGSVSTLMRPNAPAGLQEKWIIPILREVAEAMRWVHAQGIIHRDLKGANVLVTEEGSVQLCDFGVAGVIESKFDKRTTVIGTPNWMAPELFDETTSYGTEVDIWAFGAMAYEIAFGQPPNVTLGMDFSKLGSHLKHNSPRLEGEHFSTELKDLVAFCLQNDRALRPSIDQVRRHRYIVDTEAQFPTSSLSHLVRAFKLWEAQGGDRRSLFSAGGAQGLEGTISTDAINDDWNFSTTAAFDEHVFNDGGAQDIYDVYGSDAEIVEDFSENTTLQAKSRPRRRPPKNVPTVKQPLEKLFDPNTLSNYEDNSRLYYRPFQPTPITDLPLRDDTMPAPDVRESLIDLDESLNGSRLSHFADVDTIRPNGFQAMSEEHNQNDQAAQSSTNPAVDNTHRRTRDWKFPTMVFTPTSREDGDAHHRSQLQSLSEMPQLESADSNANLSTVDTNDLIRLERTASIASLIDLDMSILNLHDFDVDRPSTPHSGVESVTSSEVSVVSPFEFERHASLQGAFGASHIREPSIYVADDEGFADNHLNSAAHNPVLRDDDALSLDNRHGVVTGRPYSLSEFADTDPELLMPTEPQGVSQDAFQLFTTQENDQQHNENGLQSTKRSITEHTIALPSLAEAPAVDVMQGRATQQDVKCELQRMARSLSEHLSYANQILANLPVGQVALTQKPSKTP